MKSNIFKNEIVYSLKVMIIQRRECGNSGCTSKRWEKNDITWAFFHQRLRDESANIGNASPSVTVVHM